MSTTSFCKSYTGGSIVLGTIILYTNLTTLCTILYIAIDNATINDAIIIHMIMFNINRVVTI